MRKGDDSLKRSLEKVIVPIFCHTFAEADEQKQQKLTKVCNSLSSQRFSNTDNCVNSFENH